MKNLTSTKGISKRKNGTFEAYVTVKQTGKRSNARMKVYVGTFPTEKEASSARVDYIKSLV